MSNGCFSAFSGLFHVARHRCPAGERRMNAGCISLFSGLSGPVRGRLGVEVPT